MSLHGSFLKDKRRQSMNTLTPRAPKYKMVVPTSEKTYRHNKARDYKAKCYEDQKMKNSEQTIRNKATYLSLKFRPERVLILEESLHQRAIGGAEDSTCLLYRYSERLMTFLDDQDQASTSPTMPDALILAKALLEEYSSLVYKLVSLDVKENKNALQLSSQRQSNGLIAARLCSSNVDEDTTSRLWLQLQQNTMYCDSQSAIAISCNPVQHSRTKHIHTRYHFIKEHVENGEAEVYQVSNDDTIVAQRWLEEKQLEEKTNTDCLVKDQEKEYHTGWKIKMSNALDSCNQRSTQQCMKSEVAKHLGVAWIQQQNVEDTTKSTYLVNRSPLSAIGFKKSIDMLGALHGFKFEVEPHGNVDHVVGSQEVQTQDLIYYHSTRDTEQHSA
ncbi:zinc finger, CCHC-type containing protein [Tanacetum coccineum]|uniref:Zinc finger, CCHC-type containing protein n=1 Tax=Tanacetum coccineum TaxID=301880 RepID=A0ABQ5FUD2_9ASTR